MDTGAGAGAGARRLSGGLRELWYRAIGRGPVPDAGDRVLAERIRSVLGPLERRHGLDPVEVTVAEGVALVRAGIPDGEVAGLVVTAVSGVSGVRQVRFEWASGPPDPGGH